MKKNVTQSCNLPRKKTKTVDVSVHSACCIFSSKNLTVNCKLNNNILFIMKWESSLKQRKKSLAFNINFLPWRALKQKKRWTWSWIPTLQRESELIEKFSIFVPTLANCAVSSHPWPPTCGIKRDVSCAVSDHDEDDDD